MAAVRRGRRRGGLRLGARGADARAEHLLGALGLFGTGVGELNDADRLVAQTLAHIACVAILQDHPATPATVFPHLHAALTSRIVVDQARGSSPSV